MIKYKVTEACLCEGYLHELTHYYRSGLREKSLNKGDEVEFLYEWNNFYGFYYKVQKDGVSYDIPPSKLERLS